MIGEGDIKVGEATEQEEDDPGQVEAHPDGLGQRNGVAHDALDQRLVADEVAGGEAQGEQPVDHRRLPFEEGFAVESQGQATEHQAGGQGQPLAFFQAALGEEDRPVDHHRGGDQHGGGAEDAAQHDAVPGEFDGARLELVNDEEEDERDEVDELFHGGSQKRDVAA